MYPFSYYLAVRILLKCKLRSYFTESSELQRLPLDKDTVSQTNLLVLLLLISISPHIPKWSSVLFNFSANVYAKLFAFTYYNPPSNAQMKSNPKLRFEVGKSMAQCQHLHYNDYSYILINNQCACFSEHCTGHQSYVYNNNMVTEIAIMEYYWLLHYYFRVYYYFSPQ